jgi:predicted TIM-barrel fold metal-dependent hydrolase
MSDRKSGAKKPRSPGVFDGLKVIDVDTHISEPHDLWTSHAPASYCDRVPQVKQIDGTEHWVVDGDVDLGPAIPVSVIRRDGQKSDGVEFFGWKLDDVHVASHDMKARVQMMDEIGVHAQVVYPNVAGFGNQNFMKIEDEALREICATVYNDAMVEIQRDSNGRIFPMALVPWWNIDACAREVERAHELGLRGVVMCSDPDSVGLPDLADPAWDPFWDVCGELGMPVNFHIGASQTSFNMFGRASWGSMDMAERLALGSTTLFFENARVLGNLLYSGILERFPKVKVVSVESGIGWIPFVLEALDYEMHET